MSTTADKRDSPETEVSRAIDEVLTAERDAARAIESASEAAEDMRRATTETAHRIGARAERRIGAVHRQVTVNLERECSRLRGEAKAAARDAPKIQLDEKELQRLVAAAAEWLTTDADD